MTTVVCQHLYRPRTHHSHDSSNIQLRNKNNCWLIDAGRSNESIQPPNYSLRAAAFPFSSFSQSEIRRSVLSGGDDGSCAGNYRSIPCTRLSYWAHVLPPQYPLTFFKERPGERAEEEERLRSSGRRDELFVKVKPRQDLFVGGAASFPVPCLL